MRRVSIYSVAFVAGVFLGAGLIFYVELSRVYELAIEARVRASVVHAQLIDAKAALLESPVEPVTILFVGDVMLSRGVGRQMEKQGDFRYSFLKIAETLRAADLAFGNLEGPISDRGTKQGSEYSFRADPRAVEGLDFAGFDVLSLANNHIWDWGAEALADTLKHLHQVGIRTVGAGRNEVEANRPVVFEIGGIKIAFLAYTDRYPMGLEAKGSEPGVSRFDVEQIKKAVESLSKDHLVIVSLHWGEEYAAQPSSKQREIAHALVEAGADFVVGHHPHVIQAVERYKSGWIAYSLGNFVFDQNFSKETMQGLVLIVTVQDGRISNVVQEKIMISPTFQSYLP